MARVKGNVLGRWTWIACTGAVIALVAWMLILRARHSSLEGQARTILANVESGDGNALYQCAYDHEKRELKLTPEKIAALYSRLILPRFAGFHSVGPMHTMINQDGSQAVAWHHMVDAKGHAFDLDVSPWATSNGAKQMIMARLETAWIVEYRLLRNQPMDSIGCIDAQIEGLAHDRGELERIGIYGFVQDDPSSKIQGFDDMLNTFKTNRRLIQADNAKRLNMAGH